MADLKRLRFPKKPLRLEAIGDRPVEYHVFDEDSFWAIKAALGSQRPLLVRGEPGVGKTQLARAAAMLLRRPLIDHTVDARTESRDLLWTFDAVQRLAEAQVSSVVCKTPDELAERLSVEKFLHPGPLWWAFDWSSASDQAQLVGEDARSSPPRWKPAKGTVLLIDEIDKGERDVPNGLLEALGAGRFKPQGRNAPVTATGEMPLVVITTNEERVLPDAFVRRCLVLNLNLPLDDDEWRQYLVRRGRAHFQQDDNSEPDREPVADAILEEAASWLVADRNAAKAKHVLPLPGQAEYLDLIRAVSELKNEDDQLAAMGLMRKFVFEKHRGTSA